ncbi:histone deacetylase [Streptomyces sp. NPDC101393]|uniref:histone deacetylase n=1 Tax=Streptomyces sp. NPDC101393 TaxID=3366141 RepID=UPI0037FDF5B5
MIPPRRLHPLVPLESLEPPADQGDPARPLWYAAYGSNMHLDRLAYYLEGGRPPGALRTYPGCRDPRPPVRSSPVLLPGRLYFAAESPVWTGGSAFFDPDADGELPALAHLVTAAQFSDIAAQEVHREPGRDLDLTQLLRHGRERLGPGRYETLVYAGLLDGCPVVTFTAPGGLADAAVNAPSPAYLRHLVAGLVSAHGWSPLEAATYLASCPGAAGQWPPAAIAALLTEDPSG